MKTGKILRLLRTAHANINEFVVEVQTKDRMIYAALSYEVVEWFPLNGVATQMPLPMITWFDSVSEPQEFSELELLVQRKLTIDDLYRILGLDNEDEAISEE